ncbi:hypothetical protein EUTSA_v10029107mg [Eutrema salsugineum]|uniref:Uncharacterized protein n=1 Tax=Eutrema salsugineum TaxID=72664 RepID=V4KLF2_EUTSA|nr:hypothetical protein EUTSA_v10029107mg [Eutrema salsugineum]
MTDEKIQTLFHPIWCNNNNHHQNMISSTPTESEMKIPIKPPITSCSHFPRKIEYDAYLDWERRLAHVSSYFINS